MELRKGNNRTILTADKGVAMMVMDRKDYIDKANTLLVQPSTGTQLINLKPTFLPALEESIGNQE